MNSRQNKDGLTFTAQTYIGDRILENGCRLYRFLSDNAEFYNLVKRTLLKDTMSTGESPLSLKNAYLKRFGVTARQSNAVRYDVGGALKSVKELQKLHIGELSERIKSAEKWLKGKAACIRRVKKKKNF